MCGFAGYLDFARSGDPQLAAAMAARLRHRGPDDAGDWADPAAGYAVGFRRLSILDLSPEGHQPMTSAGGRYVLAFNGEVYNHVDLRDELRAAGARFRGHSDTEVMLAAFERWGVGGAVRRFAGMFAFALWDRDERTLHLGRDRLGEKPLYYGRSGGAVLFGSELKALRAHPRFAGEIDRDALSLYVRFGTVPAPHSIYRGVFKLPQGSLLTVRAADPGAMPEPVRYWDPTARGLAPPADDREAIDRLESLLAESVRRQMVADVPVGAFLSGGIDSSAVVALMRQESRHPVRTFTIGLRESRYDEADYARAVARHLGTAHTELYVTPAEVRAVIPDLPTVYDEPFGDSSAIPVYLVSRLARRQVTVALSGDGGDELFAGYPWYGRTARLWGRARRIPGAARRLSAAGLAAVARAGGGRRVGQVVSFLKAASDPGRLHLWLRSQWQGPRDVVVGVAANAGVGQPRLPDLGGDDLVRALQCLDLQTYLANDILAKVDRAAMAVGLETRTPFLDHRVAEFGVGLPLALKQRDGRVKWLLRQVLYRHVPAELVERPKMGFSIPVAEWLRGPLRSWAEDLLAEDRLRRDGYFDAGVVRAAWGEHLAGRKNRDEALWHVLMFQAWLEVAGSGASGRAWAGDTQVSRAEGGRKCASAL